MHAHLLQMLSHSNFLSLHHYANSNTLPFPLRAVPRFLVSRRDFPPNFGSIGLNASQMSSFHEVSVDSSVCSIHGYGVQSAGIEFDSFDLDRFADVGNQLADAAGDVIRKYFRKSFDILDKEDLSPVTIADQAAEESMVQIIQNNFPSHAIYGEEKGWRCKEKVADYVWVSPVILGIIDQPVLRKRWVGLIGRKSTLKGQEISSRNCLQLSKAYLCTTSPHLFSGNAEVAFTRPYDFLALIPVIEGAGGVITDWKGNQLHWEASSKAPATSFNVAAAGDKKVHQEYLDALQWH